MTTIVELKLNLSQALNKQSDAQSDVNKAVQDIKNHVAQVVQESNCGIVTIEGETRWMIDWTL